MQKKDIIKLVEDSITDINDREIILSGIIEPQKRIAFLNLEKTSSINVLVVYQDLSENLSGYKIFYDEESDQFGIITTQMGTDYIVGFYGTFIETLESM